MFLPSDKKLSEPPVKLLQRTTEDWVNIILNCQDNSPNKFHDQVTKETVLSFCEQENVRNNIFEELMFVHHDHLVDNLKFKAMKEVRQLKSKWKTMGPCARVLTAILVIMLNACHTEEEANEYFPWILNTLRKL